MVFSKWGPFVPFIHSITNLLDQKLYWTISASSFPQSCGYCVLHGVHDNSRAEINFTIMCSRDCIGQRLGTFKSFLFSRFLHPCQYHLRLVYYLFVFALVKMQQQPGRAYGLLALLSRYRFQLGKN